MSAPRLLGAAQPYLNQDLSLPTVQDPFIRNINSKVLKVIEQSYTVPGLKDGVFEGLKSDVIEYWKTLVETGCLMRTGADRDIRPYFASLQGIIEHVLAEELGDNVESLIGVIHTPAPATPLCTEGKISKGLVDPSIETEADPARRFTIEARAAIVRDYLNKGGTLYIAYPEGGFAERSEEQLEIYLREQETHKNLFDCPLEVKHLSDDLVGAFYLFKNKEGKLYAFAINMTQAKDPKDYREFGLWFGECKPGSLVSMHIYDVLEVLKHSKTNISLPL